MMYVYIYFDLISCCVCLITVPLPIDIQCNVTSNFEQTVYSYSCGVIVNEGELGTLVCTVDGVPGEPCELSCSSGVAV